MQYLLSFEALELRRKLPLVAGLLFCSLFWSKPRLTLAQETTAAAQPAPKASIFDAIGNSDTAKVAQILKDDPTQANAFNNWGESALLRAVRSGNVDVTRALLEAKANPNTTDTYRQSSPLFAALDSNNAELIGLLADHGVNLDAVDRDGRTPLMRAASGWSQDVTKILLKKGAKINGLDQRGMLPLDAVVLNGNQDVLTLFMDNGASVKAQSVNGSTPLHAALWRNNGDVIKLMLQKGADPNVATRDGDTPLHLAALRIDAGIGTLLKAGADPTRRDAQGDLPLHIALHRLNSDIADETIQSLYPPEFANYGYASGPLLLSDDEAARVLTPLVAKSDINARDRLGISPLLLAIAARQPAVCELINGRAPRTDSTTQLFNAISHSDTPTVEKILAEKPFLVYFRLPDGTTPLHVAALWGARGSAELLLQKGADVNARDAHGMTPLRLCAGRTAGTAFSRRLQVMVDLLLEHKAEVDSRDEAGVTPLLSAARASNYGVVAQLVAAKANTVARDKTGRTALHLLSRAQDKANGTTTALLIAHGAEINTYDQVGSTALTLAIQAHQLELVKALVANGFNPDQTDFNGQNPLSLLSNDFWGENSTAEPFLRVLLEGGANPNVGVPYGESVLSRAVQSGNKNVVNLLLEYKANPNGVQGVGNYTPLLNAIYNSNKDMVALLLDKGADPNLAANNGETPLVVAQRNQNKEITALLQAKVDAQRGVNAQNAQ